MSATLVVKRVGQFVDGVIATLIVLLVVGCKVGPDYKRPALKGTAAGDAVGLSEGNPQVAQGRL